MNIAKEVAKLSHCVRAKVGCIIVKDNNIVSFGYNGTPSGIDNCCEDKNYMSIDAAVWPDPITIKKKFPFEDEKGRFGLVTKSEVLHAESNAILKSGKNYQSVQGSTMYCTLSPCFECAKMIIQSGVSKVIYEELFYRDNGSVEFLSKFIEVKKL